MAKTTHGASRLDAARWLRSQTAGSRKLVTRTIAAGLLAGLFTILQMGLLAWIIHAAVILDNSAMSLLPFFVGLVLAITGRSLAQGFQARSAALCSHTIRQNIRIELLSRWQALGPVRLLDTSAGTLAREWVEHVEALHGYFARFMPQQILCIAVPLMIVIVVAWLDWLAAIFLIISAPLIPLFMALVGMGAEKLNQEHFQLIGRLSGHFLDRIRGLTTLQLFGQTRAAAETIHTRSHQYRRVTMRMLKVAFLSSAVLEFFSSVAIAVVAMYVGFGLLGYLSFGPAPELTLFSGLFILLLAPEFFQPLRLLSQHYHDRASALGATEEILRRLESDPESVNSKYAFEEHPDEPPPAATVATEERIVIQSAHVAFPNGRVGLDSVSLVINRGEAIALTGPSGGGKTTFLHLLAGFLRPCQGFVRVFGYPAGEQRFGWLGQSAFMVQGSWADNLRVTCPDATDGMIESALQAAGLGDLLTSRSGGIHSLVSEAGGGLSGGQARRLGLARLFLADVDLILLDEPTAALDAESERFVLASLQRLSTQGKTLVFATHHPSLLGLATRVIRIDGGRILNE
ncbi:MAG: thiol reductant ABC exporter subunit CydD [Marinobacter sp.]|uniref:thiol reductant ABC exporter subunit CydD n=1 Tax=Marinobacter sp. TaxID=50741 RepID=UPI0034A020CC